MVFQNPNPFPMSIYDNIAYGPRTAWNHGSKQNAGCRLLRKVTSVSAAIWDEVKGPIEKVSAMGLSGGQQQRLCIARAFSN